MADQNTRRRLYRLLLDFYKGKLTEDFFDDVAYRKFYRKIYFETFRHLGFIQKTLNGYLKNETVIEAYAALVLGISQILYIDDIPDYAAVNESVTLASHRHKGFINAVLRNVVRDKETILKNYQIQDDFPDWFIKRWKKRFDSKEEFTHFLTSLNTPPAFYAIDLENQTVHDYDTITDQEREKFYSMDKVSAMIPSLAGTEFQPNSILDACAAPGGKTLNLSHLYPNARITAIEKNGQRIQVLNENIEKYSSGNVIAQKANFLTIESDATYDFILLDAPCTALGTMRKHPEVRWFKSPKDISKMSQYQMKFLETAVDMLNPGGRLIFSVCSLEPEEGIENIASFLKNNDNFRQIEPECEASFIKDNFFFSYPHQSESDGFFACVLEKTP